MADKNKKISKKLAARFTAFRDKAAKETIKRLANPQRGKNTDLGKDVVKGLGGYSMGGKVPKGYHRMPNGKLMKDSAMKKKMGGGMMQRPMGYDKGGDTFLKRRMKLGRLSLPMMIGIKVVDSAKKILKKKMSKPKKKMGGGMMQRPMGYDKGGSSFMDDIVDNMGKDYDNALNKEMSKEIRNRQKVNKRDGSVETAEYDIDHNKMESNAVNKVKKKYGFDKGGMARGMGAAIKGGKFQGVF